jgi:lanthionine synthetase-like protein
VIESRIAEIVADAEAAFDGERWPAHPLDAEVTESEARTLYLGAAGMAWALRRLGSTLEVPLEPIGELPGLLLGDAGILLVTRADDGRLQRLIDENARNPACELLWGAPGTIVAAKHAGLDAASSVAALMEERGVWTQVLEGYTVQCLGAAHGFAGNVAALRGLVPDDELRSRVESVLRAHAVWDGDTVNWPPEVGDKPTRTQWCHGAPGIVALLGELLPEDLLLAGAEHTWRTGPLEKGPGLCHGTAGNGYALLKTYAVTGDARWLERARSFAVAALDQVQGRYSLMTGDIGVALFARACLEVDPRFPVVELW